MIINYKYIVAVWICLGYLALGGHFTLVPNEMSKVFGKNAVQLYSYLFTYKAITGITEVVLQIELMKPSNLGIFFYMYSAFSIVSLLILLIFYKGDKVTVQIR